MTRAVPQGSVLGSQPYHIFINDINSKTECTLSKFVDDTKLRGAVDAETEKDGMPSRRTWTSLRSAHENLMKFNKPSCSAWRNESVVET